MPLSSSSGESGSDGRDRDGRDRDGRDAGRRDPLVRDSDEDGAAARMRERAVFIIEGQPGDVSSSLLARELLGISGAPEEVAHSLLAPILAGDPRLEDAGASGWRLRSAPIDAMPSPSLPSA